MEAFSPSERTLLVKYIKFTSLSKRDQIANKSGMRNLDVYRSRWPYLFDGCIWEEEVPDRNVILIFCVNSCVDH